MTWAEVLSKNKQVLKVIVWSIKPKPSILLKGLWKEIAYTIWSLREPRLFSWTIPFFYLLEESFPEEAPWTWGELEVSQLPPSFFFDNFLAYRQQKCLMLKWQVNCNARQVLRAATLSLTESQGSFQCLDMCGHTEGLSMLAIIICHLSTGIIGTPGMQDIIHQRKKQNGMVKIFIKGNSLNTPEEENGASYFLLLSVPELVIV